MLGVAVVMRGVKVFFMGGQSACMDLKAMAASKIIVKRIHKLVSSLLCECNRASNSIKPH